MTIRYVDPWQNVYWFLHERNTHTNIWTFSGVVFRVKLSRSQLKDWKVGDKISIAKCACVIEEMTNEEIDSEVAKFFSIESSNASTDLNECKTLWKRLTLEQKKEYATDLNEIVFRESLGIEYTKIEDLEKDTYGLTLNAPPRQRAKAFLKLIKLPQERISVAKKRMSFCSNCNKTADVSTGGSHEDCHFVFGRRGWRQLGAYDG